MVHYEWFELSLLIASVSISCIEERNVHFVRTSIFAEKSNLYTAFNMNTNSSMIMPSYIDRFARPDFLRIDTTWSTPSSLRISAVCLICALVYFPNKSKVVFWSFTYFALAGVALAAEYFSNRSTRILQAIYVCACMWFLLFSIRWDVRSRRMMSNALLFYVGCVVYKSAYSVCTSRSFNEFVSDGCVVCDVRLTASMAAVGASAMSSSTVDIFLNLIVQEGGAEDLDARQKNNRRAYYLERLAVRKTISQVVTGLCVVSSAAILLLSGSIVADNPTFMPLRKSCIVNATCPNNYHDFVDGVEARRNAVTVYMPTTVLLLTLSRVAHILDSNVDIRTQMTTLYSVLAILSLYLSVRLVRPLFRSSGIYLLTDTSFGVFLLGILLKVMNKVPEGLATFVLQTSIVMELVPTWYSCTGFVEFISYFTMYCDTLLTVLVYGVLFLQWLQCHRCLAVVYEMAVVCVKSISLFLLLAYSSGFSMINGPRAERILGIVESDEIDTLDSHVIKVIGLHVGVRAIMLHFAPAAVACSLVHPELKRTSRWCNLSMWFGISAAVVALYFAMLAILQSHVPNTYPLSDSTITGMVVFIAVLLPFVCAA